MRTHSTLRHACLGGQWLGGLATYGALVAAIVGITGCGDDTKPGPAALVSGSATIGPAGGTVTAGDVKVDVPAGALAANVEIKINETRDAPPPAFDVSTRIVRFEPHGTAFAAPVTVSFARPASGRPRIYWSRGYKSPYLPLVTRVEGERVVAKVDHFSFGAWVDEAANNAGAGAQDFVNTLAPECTSTAQCPPNSDCTNNKCEPRPLPATPQACTNSATCSAGLVCINLFCVPPVCGNNAGCPAVGFECNDGACVRGSSFTVECGDACATTAQCKAGLTCFGSRCLVMVRPLTGHTIRTQGDVIAVGDQRAGEGWYGPMFGPVLGEVAFAFHGGGFVRSAPDRFLDVGPFENIPISVPEGAVSGRAFVGPAGADFVTSGCAVYSGSFVYILPTPSGVSPRDNVTSGSLVEVTGHALEGAGVAIARDAYGDCGASNPCAGAEVVSSNYSRLVFKYPGGSSGGYLHMRGPPTEDHLAGEALTWPGFAFTVASSLVSVSPPAAPIGTRITVTGTRLFETSPPTRVRIGAFEAAVVETRTVGYQQELVFVVPEGAVTGPLVIPTLAGPLSWRDPFYVLPTFQDFAPLEGPVGATITITGRGLRAVRSVLIGPGSAMSLDAPITLQSDTRITATVPDLPLGQYVIRLITDDGFVDGPTGFTIREPEIVPARITGLVPSTGVVGAELVIQGFGLAGTTSVTFKAAAPGDRVNAQQLRILSDTQVLVAVPEGAASGSVLVYNRAGFASVAFTLLVPPPPAPPVLASFTPPRASRGAYVHIQGSNLASVTKVRFSVSDAFAGHEVAVTPSDDNNIVVQIPTVARDGDIAVVRDGFAPSRSTSQLTIVEWQTPRVESTTPESGPVGTQVLLTGRDLDAVDSVVLNLVTNASVEVPTELFVRTDRALAFTVTTGAPGLYDLVLRLRREVSRPIAFARFEITGDAPPARAETVIHGVWPPSGSPETLVYVFGTDLNAAQGLPSVFVNGTPVAIASVAPTQLTFRLPAGATTGPIFISADGLLSASTEPLLVLGGTSTRDAEPKVLEVAPDPAPLGGVVTLRGMNLGTTMAVVVGQSSADFVVLSDDEVRVTLPFDLALGETTVTVRNTGGETASHTLVTRHRDVPTVEAIVPASGPAGTVVRVRGTGLAGLNLVVFDGAAATGSVPAQFQAIDDLAFQTVVPAGAVTGPIRFFLRESPTSIVPGITPTFTVVPTTTGGGTGTTPRITSFDPQSGAPQSSVVVTGSGFDGTTRVAFRGIPAAFSLQGTTQLTATVPYGAATGPISVTNPTDTATSATDFTVLPAVTPSITGTTPTFGPAGTEVTITGIDLGGLVRVAFESAPALIVSASETQLVVRVPFDAPLGFVNLVVTTAAGVAQTTFAVLEQPAPTLLDTTPDAAKRGETLTLTGTGFFGATGVFFDGAPASFTVTNATTMSVVVPAGLTSTTHTITVETPRGTATSPELFTVLPSPPTITSLSVLQAPPGNEVVVTGTDFVGVSSVVFAFLSQPGLVPAGFVALSTTSLRVTVPSTAGGLANLTVETPDGTASTLFGLLRAGFPLTVAKGGTGTGIITSTDGGEGSAINCGTLCAVHFPAGSSITLTATSSSGSTFTGWSGDCTGTSTTCTVSMSVARNVIATFQPVATTGTLVVVVSRRGTGVSGRVTSAPSGIDCTTSPELSEKECLPHASLPIGPVTLTATPGANSLFAGWSVFPFPGCTGNPCGFPLAAQAGGAAFQVEATFLSSTAGETQTLTLTPTGGAALSGGVRSAPSNFNVLVSQGPRIWRFETGASVTLTAYAVSNGLPVSVTWGGDCASAGTATTCTLTMSAARTVTAVFPGAQ